MHISCIPCLLTTDFAGLLSNTCQAVACYELGSHNLNWWPISSYTKKIIKYNLSVRLILQISFIMPPIILTWEVQPQRPVTCTQAAPYLQPFLLIFTETWSWNISFWGKGWSIDSVFNKPYVTNLLSFKAFVLSLTHAQIDAKKCAHELPVAPKSLSIFSKRRSKTEKMKPAI